jgi:hypothetical protein
MNGISVGVVTPGKSLLPEDQSMTKLKRKAPITVSEVRRSERFKAQQQGFKAKSCQGKAWFCCDVEPPSLSSKVIKSLGKEFCKIPGSQISEATLKKKPLSKTAVVPRAKAEKKDKIYPNVSDVDGPKKKNKKC